MENFALLLLWTTTVSVYTVSVRANIDGSEFDSRREQYESGRQHYEAIQRYSQLPRYSECWLAALNQLEEGCGQLTDDVQVQISTYLNWVPFIYNRL